MRNLEDIKLYLIDEENNIYQNNVDSYTEYLDELFVSIRSNFAIRHKIGTWMKNSEKLLVVLYVNRTIITNTEVDIFEESILINPSNITIENENTSSDDYSEFFSKYDLRIKIKDQIPIDINYDDLYTDENFIQKVVSFRRDIKLKELGI